MLEKKETQKKGRVKKKKLVQTHDLPHERRDEQGYLRRTPKRKKKSGLQAKGLKKSGGTPWLGRERGGTLLRAPSGTWDDFVDIKGEPGNCRRQRQTRRQRG